MSGWVEKLGLRGGQKSTLPFYHEKNPPFSGARACAEKIYQYRSICLVSQRMKIEV